MQRGAASCALESLPILLSCVSGLHAHLLLLRRRNKEGSQSAVAMAKEGFEHHCPHPVQARQERERSSQFKPDVISHLTTGPAAAPSVRASTGADCTWKTLREIGDPLRSAL